MFNGSMRLSKSFGRDSNSRHPAFFLDFIATKQDNDTMKEIVIKKMVPDAAAEGIGVTGGDGVAFVSLTYIEKNGVPRWGHLINLVEIAKGEDKITMLKVAHFLTTLIKATAREIYLSDSSSSQEVIEAELFHGIELLIGENLGGEREEKDSE